MPKKETPVVVTTAHRGVFMGYATDAELTDCRKTKTIALVRAKNCLFWSSDLRGFVGLAAIGPNGQCKIGPPADMTLYDVTAVLNVSTEAEAKWNKA